METVMEQKTEAVAPQGDSEQSPLDREIESVIQSQGSLNNE